SRLDLISQVHFLFKTGWRNRRNSCFWFATEQDQRMRSNMLYFDNDHIHSATKFFAGHRERFCFIHPDYLNANPDDRETWLKWLKENMGVESIPRLVSILSASGDQIKSFGLNPDFEFLMKSWPSAEILLLLCDNWMEYMRWIETPIFNVVDSAFE